MWTIFAQNLIKQNFKICTPWMQIHRTASHDQIPCYGTETLELAINLPKLLIKR